MLTTLGVLGILQKIINLTFRQNGSDVVRLSRWLRCLFNLTLPLDEKISLKCLDQVTQIAAKKQGVRQTSSNSASSFSRHAPRPHQTSDSMLPMATPPTSSPVKVEDVAEMTDEKLKLPDRYPGTELEWMATSAFNRAIDYYVRDDDAKCRLWAEKAMTLAQWLEDAGHLRNLLMEKFAALQFDN